MKTKKLLTALALFGSLGLVNNSWGETVQEICQTTTETLPGAFANLMLVLDYSGSMNDYLYKNEEDYNPNELYFGYFDPFGAYVYDSNAKAFIKIANFDPDPVEHDKGKQFQHGGKDYGVQAKYRHRNENLDYDVVYSGNYLNWYYMTKVDLLRLILTGGKTTFSGNSYVEYKLVLPQNAVGYICPNYGDNFIKDVILFAKSLRDLEAKAANADALDADKIDDNLKSCILELSQIAQELDKQTIDEELEDIKDNETDFKEFLENLDLNPDDFNSFLSKVESSDFQNALTELRNDIVNYVIDPNKFQFKNDKIKDYITHIKDYVNSEVFEKILNYNNISQGNIDPTEIADNFYKKISENLPNDLPTTTASSNFDRLINLCNKITNCEYDATQNAIIYKAYAPQSLLQFYCPMLDTFNADWAKRHFFCRFLPHGYLRRACHNGDVQISCQTETGTLFVELQDGTKIYANSTITYNPANGQVEGLLQRLEEVSYKPRVGAALYSNPSDDEVIKDWIYPGYSYSGVIDVINNENPEGTTPTGEAFDEIKRYFSRESGVWGGFSTNDAGYVDPYTFTINVDNYTIEDSKNLNILISDGAWNGHGGVYNYPPSNCLNDSVPMKNLPDLSVSTKDYYRCAIDPAQPVYNMWKGSKADLVSELSGNQTAETISVPVLMDSSQSYGLNAMKNIAIAGGFIDKDNDQLPAGYTSEPPNPQCGADQEPPCGSFVDIPSADSDPNNEWHTNSGEIVNYYSASQPYDLLSALVKSFENAVGKIKKVSCQPLLETKELPSTFIENFVTNTIKQVQSYINEDNFSSYKEAILSLLQLIHYDLYLANYPYMAKIDYIIEQVKNAPNPDNLKTVFNNALSTISLSYRQALMTQLNSYIKELNEATSIAESSTAGDIATTSESNTGAETGTSLENTNVGGTGLEQIPLEEAQNINQAIVELVNLYNPNNPGLNTEEFEQLKEALENVDLTTYKQNRIKYLRDVLKLSPTQLQDLLNDLYDKNKLVWAQLVKDIYNNYSVAILLWLEY